MGDILIASRLLFGSISWKLANTSRSGGVSLTGQEQVVQAPTGRWTAMAVLNVFTGQEDPSALMYRSLIRRGRGAIVIVPEVDTRGPAHYAGIQIPRLGVRHSDDALYSDGTGYAQSYSGARLGASAAINATQIQIILGRGLTLLPGMRFSTPDNRMHEIDEVLAFDGTAQWTVLVAPWLRAAYPDNTPLDFDEPRCRMRLATDDTGALTVAQRSLSTPSIEFAEAF